MRVSTYSRNFHAEHDSINSDRPVSMLGPEVCCGFAETSI